MKYYALTGYEENTILAHDKEFSEDEFKKMCNEAPLFIFGEYKAYDTSNIIEYIVNKYGFQELAYKATFYKDGEPINPLSKDGKE